MKRIARTPYMRNLWSIMKTFKVLPTNEDFRKLTDDQIDMIIYSMLEDHREMELARKGIRPDADYYDSSFEEEVWNKAPGEWEVLKEGHDPDEIARQVEELTREEDRRNLAMKFDSLDEYNKFLEEGGKTARETEIEQYINKQIALAEEKARRLNATKGKQVVDDKDRPEAQSALSDKISDLDKEAIDRNIALFNEENGIEFKHDDDDDDDFTVL